MAILKGFPPSNVLEPGMLVERTNTAHSGSHRAALIGFASKGPVNVVTTIKSIQQLHVTFGYPHPENGESLICCAEQVLLTTPEIVMLRVADPALVRTAFVPVSDEDEQETFTVYADSPGLEGNDTHVVIISDLNTNTFTINVFHNGVQVESWSQLSKDCADRYYVETFVELVSDWVRVRDNKASSKLPQNNIYKLGDEGGDGIPTDTNVRDGLLVGSEQELTGIYTFSNSDIDIDFIAVPGYSSSQVIEAVIEICEDRHDCMAIIDPPVEMSYLEVSLWNRDHSKSDFAAMFWPWLEIRDQYNRRNILAPPSGSVIAAIVRSDMLSAPWFSPTGETRGIVPGVINVAHRLAPEECSLVKDKWSAVNVIIPFARGEGFMIASQKTLQKSRMDVRRMLIFVEKRIRQAANEIEPSVDLGNELFRNEFTQICEKVMGQVKNGGGINSYLVQTNGLDTPEQVEKNEFRTVIGVQPVNDNKNIYIEFLFSASRA